MHSSVSADPDGVRRATDREAERVGVAGHSFGGYTGLMAAGGTVDPAVIAGVSVTMGDKVLDGTVRTNLELLRKQLGKTAVR